MKKALLALGVAAVALSAAPADAKRYHKATCAKWRHGHCVAWRTSRHSAMYRVGYRFGPRYGYSTYRTLPRTYVSRYDLSPDYRYVYRDNYIYVVNPRTYAVERVIDALTR